MLFSIFFSPKKLGMETLSDAPVFLLVYGAPWGDLGVKSFKT